MGRKVGSFSDAVFSGGLARRAREAVDADDVVPYPENGAIVKERYEKLGGPVTVLIKHGLGHHPHGLDNPAPVVEFILKHTSVADELAAGIGLHVQQALEAVLSPRQLPSVTEFEGLVVTGSWTELWPDARGGETKRTAKGRIWNAAIAATLAKHGAAYLPKRNEPYYLDDPIVLKAGQRLSADREGTAEIRVLPGVKNFANHAKLDCFVADCVFRDLYDIRTVKLYDQPSLGLGPRKDFSDPIGTIRNVYFSKLSFCRPGSFQIAADVDGLFVNDVRLDFAFGGDYKLVEVGPMSATWKYKPDDPSKWVEVFSPDRDVTVRNFRMTNIRVKAGDTMKPLSDPEARLVKVSDQKPNLDYPKTTPRGGTGKAYWIR